MTDTEKLEDRRTRIIATLGPATDSPEKIEQLLKAGVNVFRLNMSHAPHEKVREHVAAVREISDRLDIRAAILMDTQGPAIRTGELHTDLALTPGERIVLSVRGERSEEHVSVDVNYDHLVDDISVGNVVMVDNGNIKLKVLEKRRNQLHCEVLTEGTLGSRRHINLPGVRVNLPALTEKDLQDIQLGIDLGVDFFAMSFVREAADVVKLKGILEFNRAPQQVIAKLEDQQGVSNLDEIIEVSDAIMVARGDLGIECPFEELPIIQRRIVKRCIARGKRVIVATHMLESMIEMPSPTRAEVTDVANAVFEQADAIMLSGETSVGQYPAECVAMMDRIARRTERSGGAGYGDAPELQTTHAHLVKSAVTMAQEIEASAIVVFTQKGQTARSASRLRPSDTPIYAFTDDRNQVNQLLLFWGVTPFFIEFADDPLDRVAEATRVLRERGLLKSGDKAVYVTEVRHGEELVDTVLMKKIN